MICWASTTFPIASAFTKTIKSKVYQPPLIGAVTEGVLVEVDEMYAVDPDTEAVLLVVVLDGIVR